MGLFSKSKEEPAQQAQHSAQAPNQAYTHATAPTTNTTTSMIIDDDVPSNLNVPGPTNVALHQPPASSYPSAGTIAGVGATASGLPKDTSTSSSLPHHSGSREPKEHNSSSFHREQPPANPTGTSSSGYSPSTTSSSQSKPFDIYNDPSDHSGYENPLAHQHPHKDSQHQEEQSFSSKLKEKLHLGSSDKGSSKTSSQPAGSKYAYKFLHFKQVTNTFKLLKGR